MTLRIIFLSLCVTSLSWNYSSEVTTLTEMVYILYQVYTDKNDEWQMAMGVFRDKEVAIRAQLLLEQDCENLDNYSWYIYPMEIQ